MNYYFPYHNLYLKKYLEYFLKVFGICILNTFCKYFEYAFKILLKNVFTVCYKIYKYVRSGRKVINQAISACDATESQLFSGRCFKNQC